MSKFTKQIERILAEAEEAGFQRGWNAAKDAFDNTVAKLKVGGSALPATPHGPKMRRKKTKKTRKPSTGRITKGTALAYVLEAIEKNPGKTGAEIISLLEGVVKERTVRTMLRRLRLRDKIEKRGEGWFAI